LCDNTTNTGSAGKMHFFIVMASGSCLRRSRGHRRAALVAVAHPVRSEERAKLLATDGREETMGSGCLCW